MRLLRHAMLENQSEKKSNVNCTNNINLLMEMDELAMIKREMEVSEEKEKESPNLDKSTNGLQKDFQVEEVTEENSINFLETSNIKSSEELQIVKLSELRKTASNLENIKKEFRPQVEGVKKRFTARKSINPNKLGIRNNSSMQENSQYNSPKKLTEPEKITKSLEMAKSPPTPSDIEKPKENVDYINSSSTPLLFENDVKKSVIQELSSDSDIYEGLDDSVENRLLNSSPDEKNYFSLDCVGSAYFEEDDATSMRLAMSPSPRSVKSGRSDGLEDVACNEDKHNLSPGLPGDTNEGSKSPISSHNSLETTLEKLKSGCQETNDKIDPAEELESEPSKVAVNSLELESLFSTLESKTLTNRNKQCELLKSSDIENLLGDEELVTDVDKDTLTCENLKNQEDGDHSLTINMASNKFPDGNSQNIKYDVNKKQLETSPTQINKSLKHVLCKKDEEEADLSSSIDKIHYANLRNSNVSTESGEQEKESKTFNSPKCCNEEKNTKSDNVEISSADNKTKVLSVVALNEKRDVESIRSSDSSNLSEFIILSNELGVQDKKIDASDELTENHENKCLHEYSSDSSGLITESDVQEEKVKTIDSLKCHSEETKLKSDNVSSPEIPNKDCKIVKNLIDNKILKVSCNEASSENKEIESVNLDLLNKNKIDEKNRTVKEVLNKVLSDVTVYESSDNRNANLHDDKDEKDTVVIKDVLHKVLSDVTICESLEIKNNKFDEKDEKDDTAVIKDVLHTVLSDVTLCESLEIQNNRLFDQKDEKDSIVIQDILNKLLSNVPICESSDIKKARLHDKKGVLYFIVSHSQLHVTLAERPITNNKKTEPSEPNNKESDLSQPADVNKTIVSSKNIFQLFSDSSINFSKVDTSKLDSEKSVIKTDEDFQKNTVTLRKRKLSDNSSDSSEILTKTIKAEIKVDENDSKDAIVRETGITLDSKSNHISSKSVEEFKISKEELKSLVNERVKLFMDGPIKNMVRQLKTKYQDLVSELEKEKERSRVLQTEIMKLNSSLSKAAVEFKDMHGRKTKSSQRSVGLQVRVGNNESQSPPPLLLPNEPIHMNLPKAKFLSESKTSEKRTSELSPPTLEKSVYPVTSPAQPITEPKLKSIIPEPKFKSIVPSARKSFPGRSKMGIIDFVCSLIKEFSVIPVEIHSRKVINYLSDLVSIRNTVRKTRASYETRLNVPDYAQEHYGAQAFTELVPSSVRNQYRSSNTVSTSNMPPSTSVLISQLNAPRYLTPVKSIMAKSITNASALNNIIPNAQMKKLNAQTSIVNVIDLTADEEEAKISKTNQLRVPLGKPSDIISNKIIVTKSSFVTSSHNSGMRTVMSPVANITQSKSISNSFQHSPGTIILASQPAIRSPLISTGQPIILTPTTLNSATGGTFLIKTNNFSSPSIQKMPPIQSSPSSVVVNTVRLPSTVECVSSTASSATTTVNANFVKVNSPINGCTTVAQPSTVTVNNNFQMKHPAPLPKLNNPNTIRISYGKLAPPRPVLRTSRNSDANGIVLSWSMDLTSRHAKISNYMLYAYQESSAPPNVSMWKRVGDVKALPLPMACTLTQFLEGNQYHFAVCAVDVHRRIGPFSVPGSIMLSPIKSPSK
ncbi:Activating transcription factor 7-interacting protein 1 [Nymphon striatum]|nr:Activating transcription factor 7-interacting protein 1 [Nymphon striatum]